ncbi:hypothetical protein HPP92_004267 [Vanilla planifolia]|uniref:Uncharacterized protein n=1 Tax=Vanilla planifolia TaxID=51239 RepID=A0A835RMI0_VANPL|nr:hypothetical protein HPP92_004267 [Vanilla planifolia]
MKTSIHENLSKEYQSYLEEMCDLSRSISSLRVNQRLDLPTSTSQATASHPALIPAANKVKPTDSTKTFRIPIRKRTMKDARLMKINFFCTSSQS